MSALSPRPKNRTPVDWAEVRARLDAATNPAPASDETPAATRALLARRAAELARPLAAAVGARAEGALEVIAFELGGQTFAFEAAYVQEAVLPREITPLPGLPSFVRGLANVRSRVLPALDLRPLLHAPLAAEGAEEKLLIVEFEGAEFGVLVERVLGLSTLTGALRREVPGLNEKYLRGIAEDGLILLDLAALFPDLVVTGQE